MANREGPEKIAQMIDTQGLEIAPQILQARQVSDSMTLADRLPKHLAIVSIKATECTIDGYKKIAAQTWLPYVGQLQLDKTTREGRPLPPLRRLKPQNMCNAHGLLSSILQSAIESGHIDKSVANGVPLPEDDHADEKRFLLVLSGIVFILLCSITIGR